jgi:LuxR family maltose regulon positive regulatory protein
VEIRTRDLRFTPDESAAFLDKVLATPLSPSVLALLDQRLEGWIAGLRLVTLSVGVGANAESDLANLSGSHFEIADYLMDEVLASQTPAILRFLLATSILERFCAPLCESVLGVVSGSDDAPCDVSGCIQWLERNNLFVIPLDDDRQWYRYHHLFRELLHRKLLDEAGSEQVTGLHRQAADWFAGQGLIDDALRHARAINDLDLSAQLMLAGLCDVLNREDRATLDRWLRMLPDEFIERNPWLLMIKAIAFGLSWQIAASWRALDQIEALLAEGPHQRAESLREAVEPPLQKDEGNERPLHVGDSYDLSVLRGVIATLRGQEAYSRGEADRAIAHSKEALALLPSRWRCVRGAAVIYWGLGMQATGRGDAAERMLLDEYTGLLDKTDSYALRLLFTAGFNAIEAGRLEQARRLALTMLDQAASSRLPLAEGFAHYFLGVVHYYWNELDAAGQYFGQLVAERQSAHTQGVRNGMIGLTRVHVARGESAAAWAVMELLSQFDLDRLGLDSDDTRSLRAQLEYLQGDTASAFRWADGYAAPVVGRSLLWLQDPHLARARILLARGTDADAQSALDILDVLLASAERTFNIRVQIEILALRALALEKQGKAADALAALRRAVELSRPGGFIRVFVDLGPPMQTLLLRLAGEGDAVEAVGRIQAAFSEPQDRIGDGDAGSAIRAANARLVEPLTDRELDVLALLREHLSNKEIAHQLCLSPTTVKRYTVNLYGKLGVNRRWDAVTEAEALGILPPH